MSRKSRRRRLRDPQNAAPQDGFDFLDDRETRETVAPIPTTPLGARTGSPAAGRGAPVNAAPPVAVAPAVVESVAVSAPRHTNGAPAPAAIRPAVTIEVDLSPAFAPAREARGGVAVAEAAPPVAAVSDVDSVAAAGTAPAVDAAATPAVVEPLSEPAPTVGEMLIAARESRGLSLEAVSARTRIPSKMLQHLESDRFAEFAADTYARGTLRAYGSFLGVDLTALFARYETVAGHSTASASLGAVQASAPAFEAPLPSKSPRTARAPWLDRRIALIAAGIVVVAGAGFAGVTAWRHGSTLRPQAGLNQIESELRRSQPEPTAVTNAPPTAEDVVPVRQGEDTAPGVPGPGTTAGGTSPVTDMIETPSPQSPAVPVARAIAQVEPVASAPAAVDGGLVLTATAAGPCTVRLVADGPRSRAVPFHFTQSGESRSWSARKSFRLVTKRGENLQLTLNGRPIPTPVDGRAIVVDRSTLEPKAAPAAARRQRPRPRVKPAPSAPPAIFEPHSGMLPPR